MHDVEDKPGRILMVTSLPYFQWRGSPIRIGFNLLAAVKNGYEVDLLTLPVGEDKPVDGVRILRVANPFNVTNIPIGPSFHKLVFDMLLLVRAVGLARRNRYRIVHGFEDTGLVAWIAAKVCGAKTVFEKHSDPASHRDKPLKNLILMLYRWVEKRAMRRADAIIGTGESLCDMARAAAPGKPVHHIFDIPSSLVEPDPDEAQTIRQSLQASPDEVLALYVGSFAVYQGLDLMFKAMPYVVKRHPHVRFIIIGGTDGEIEERRLWLRNNGMEDRVTFPGKVPPDRLPHYLAAADILLSPRSSGVNTPLKLLDYMKAARPIVATDNPANRKILDDSFAILVEPHPPAFADGISHLAGDEDLRLRFGANGRQLMDETFNFEEFARRLGRCYAEVAGAPETES